MSKVHDSRYCDHWHKRGTCTLPLFVIMLVNSDQLSAHWVWAESVFGSEVLNTFYWSVIICWQKSRSHFHDFFSNYYLEYLWDFYYELEEKEWCWSFLCDLRWVGLNLANKKKLCKFEAKKDQVCTPDQAHTRSEQVNNIVAISTFPINNVIFAHECV